MRRFNGWMDVDKLGDDRVRRGEEPPPSYFLAGGEIRCLYVCSRSYLKVEVVVVVVVVAVIEVGVC